MRRIYFAVLILVISLMACSLGGGGQTVDNEPDVSQPSDSSQEKDELPEVNDTLEEPSAPQTISDVEVGDCGSGIGPGVNLAKCDLMDQNLSESSLSGANLAQANFSISNLSKVDFSNSNLAGAVATESNMSSANFSNADLTNAILSGSNLIGADFTGAITAGVDFSGCNMTGAIITQEQLDQALSINGAVLPDGSIGK